MEATASRSKGFTLIELLVVIAIIGLLASIILASLSTAQKKGRDARRISDIKEVQLALELYYDANNSYPVQGSALSTAPSAQSLPNAALVPTYISQNPGDPTAASPYFYQYESLNADSSACSSGSCPAYVLVAQLEAGSNASTWTGTVGGSSTVCPTSAPGSAPYPYCVHS